MPKEHVPAQAYGLLRRIDGKGPQRIRHDQIDFDDSADYLVSRGLAVATSCETGDRIESTESGAAVGLIEWSPINL